jgi:hypothetical protein
MSEYIVTDLLTVRTEGGRVRENGQQNQGLKSKLPVQIDREFGR